jgi:hypothetical protein
MMEKGGEKIKVHRDRGKTEKTLVLAVIYEYNSLPHHENLRRHGNLERGNLCLSDCR